MRRKEKEIRDIKKIEAIIRNASVLRIAMAENNMPYIVPVCFGYEKDTLYLHSAPTGKKVSMFEKNQNVCFELDINVRVVRNEAPCEWGMIYQSVIGFGKAWYVHGLQAKKKALAVIMKQYGAGSVEFSDARVKSTAVIRIDITEMTGKTSGPV